MGPASEEDPETLVEKARYAGNYVNGQKSGVGKMVYPNGDVYEGEWVENKVRRKRETSIFFFTFSDSFFFA